MRAQRRKTYSKTGKHTLCEPAQAKRTWACHKNHFMNIYKKNAGPQAHKSHFVRKSTGKMPDQYSGDSVLCEPARSERK